jgi:hypothetical protein
VRLSAGKRRSLLSRVIVRRLLLWGSVPFIFIYDTLKVDHRYITLQQ